MTNEEKKQPTEKRAHPRIGKHFMTRYRIYKGADYAGGWHVSPTKDLSLGGCLLVSETPFKIGDILELDMQIPFLKDKKMRFLGEVARFVSSETHELKIYEIGVSFMKMDDKKKEEFTQIIKSMYA